MFSRTSFDGHILVVAARGFLLAMGRCPDLLAGFPLDEPKKAAITALRNIYEHWDEYLDDYRASRPLVGKSGRAFANRSPHGKPWSMEYGGKGPVLAGVLVLKDFAAILSDLEPKAIAIRERLIEERERLRQSSKAP